MTIRRNVVISGFNRIEKNSFYVCDIRNIREFNDGIYPRFPYVKYEDDTSKVSKMQGFILLIKSNLTEDEIYNSERKIHQKYKNYNYIIIYSEKNKREINLNRYSRIITISREFIFGNDLSDYFNDLYFDFIKKNNIKFTEKKKIQFKLILNYIQDKKEFKTNDIVRELNLSIKLVQRYLKDVYSLGYNLYYDRTNKSWYYLK